MLVTLVPGNFDIFMSELNKASKGAAEFNVEGSESSESKNGGSKSPDYSKNKQKGKNKKRDSLRKL